MDRPGNSSRQEAPITTGIRTPMSSSITSAIPSTPNARRTPKSEIQGMEVVSWNRFPPALKATAARTASRNTTTLVPNASCLASSSRPLGSAATTAAPTAGSATITIRNGKSLTIGIPLGRSAAGSSRRHRQQCARDQYRAAEHAQRVGAHESGLRPSQPRRGPAERGGQAVDRAVHPAVVEEDQRAGQPLARAHEQRLVDLVGVERVA